MSNYERIGTFPKENSMLTYEIVGADDRSAIQEEKDQMGKHVLPRYGESLTYGDYTIATHGTDNNLPNEVINTIQRNAWIPEILKKQVRIMYGRGPRLFEIREEEGEIKRNPVSDKYAKVMNWLLSWEQRGMPSFREYIHKTMFNYYYHEQYYSQPIYAKSRLIGGKMPVMGLKAHDVVKARLGMQGFVPVSERIEDEMLTKVLINYWDAPTRYSADIYDRFNPSDPLRSNTCISLVRDVACGEHIYSIPTGYYGLKSWVLGSNLDAAYINSFLKNSFSARKHVKIPNEWISQKENTLKEICRKNKELEQEAKPIMTEYEGVVVGTQFNYGLVQQVIDKKLESLVGVLSGSGTNQGKTFFTRTYLTEHGLEEWKIEDIPTNYGDFIKSITEFDKHALAVILAGKGLDPAISNVSNEGVFNSGAQVYYAYLVYLDSLHFSEEIITEEINRQLRINFPELQKNNVLLGFDRKAPERMQDVAPADRMAPVAKPNPKSV